MKKLTALLLTVLMLAALCACNAGDQGETPVEPGAEKLLNIAVDYEMDSLDPAMATDDVSDLILGIIAEPLIRYVNDEALPGAAASWDVNDDNTVYTFYLQPDAVFSNGEPVTAESFVYSLMRALDPEMAFPTKPDAVIKNGTRYCNGECDASEVGIEVVDEYTLRITCEYPTFPISFSDLMFVPLYKDFVEEHGEQYGSEAEYVISNGPFTVTEWVHDSTVTMVRNPSYWNADAVSLDRIVGYIDAYGSTAADMMMVDELDAADTIYAASDIEALAAEGFTQLTRISGWQFLHMSYLGSSEETAVWLNNKNFRLAVSHALDRTSLRNAVYANDIPATRFVLPEEPGADEALYWDEYPFAAWDESGNVEKAQEYLALAMEEIGVSSVDEIPTFVMLTLDSEGNMDALNAMADMWLRALGIKCVIDAQPISTMLDKADLGEYDFWKGGHSSTGVDILDYAQQYYTGYFPGYFYEDAEYDRLFDAAITATTWKARKDACFALEQYFCDNAIDIVLTYSMDVVLLDSNVTNVGFTASSIEYAYADITN